MTNVKIGILAAIAAAATSMAAPIPPAFDPAEPEMDIDIASELVDPPTAEPSKAEFPGGSSGFEPIGDPPKMLPSERYGELVNAPNPFQSFFGSVATSQPIDPPNNEPPGNVSVIPLPSGGAIAAAGVGLLGIRRRR